MWGRHSSDRRAGWAVQLSSPAVLLAAWTSFAAGESVPLPQPLRGGPSEVATHVRALGSGYENAWNRWLVQLLRLRSSSYPADSLDNRLRFVARFEAESLGTHIGADALALVERWSDNERRSRIRAFEAESIATATLPSGIADAKPFYQEAIDLHRRLGERRRLAVVLGGYGGALVNSREYADGDSILRLALDARRAIGDRGLEGNSLNDLGLANRGLGRIKEAKSWLIQAARLRETTRQPAQLGTTLGYLALTMSGVGCQDSVPALYRRALALTESAADSGRMLRVLVTFGGWLNDYGDAAEGIALNMRARDHARQMGDVGLEGEALLSLGGVLSRRARFPEAIEALERAVQLARLSNDTERLTRCLIQLGLTWAKVPDTGRARRALLRAKALADSSRDTVNQIRALNNLAMTWVEDGLPKEAQRLTDRAIGLATAKADSGSVREVANTIARLSVENRDMAAAAVWFRRAAEANDTVCDTDRAADIINLGWAELFAGRGDAALTRFEEGLSLAEKMDAHDVAWMARCGIGEAAERRGDYSTALSQLRQAASVIDTLRRRQSESESIRFLGGRMPMFEGLVHLLGKLAASAPDSAYREEAFLWAERARARQLRDMLEASGVVAALAGTPSIAEIQSRLGSDEAFLYYSVGDSSSSLWLFRHDHWRFHRLPGRDRLEAQVGSLRGALSDPSGTDQIARTRRLASALFTLLVKPVEEDLQSVRRLRIAPDGPLWRLPFEALQSTAGPGGNDPQYLVQRWTISYLPSAGLLMAPAPGTTDTSVFVVADPAYARPGARVTKPATAPSLRPLPGTSRELAILRSLAGAGAVSALAGSQATRGRVLKSGHLRIAGIVHIGAHGDIDIEPELSGLWLAPDASGRPTKLTVEDILGARPRANLATLSACQTGLGKVERGEGVIGLTRAFLAGGTRSVLVSLWDASDRWTPALMERFYRGYLRTGLPADEALARAKRDLIARTPASAPFYWALFVLVGAPDPLPGRL